MLQRDRGDSDFRVDCLGPFRLIEVASCVDKTPASRKTRALLGYLAVTGKAVARERLASLLWGDRGDEQARASLRQAIYELRSMPGGGFLLAAERDTIATGENVTTDISAIMQAAGSGDLAVLSQHLAEWRGDLLEDLPSIDPSFDGWLQTERLRVHDALVDAAVAAVTTGMERGQVDVSRKAAGLLQQRDPMNEVVLRLCLRLDCLVGDSAALHRRYERFRDLLKSELNAAPSPETQQLFQQLVTAPPPSLSQPVKPLDVAVSPAAQDIEDRGADNQVAEPVAPSNDQGARSDSRLPSANGTQAWRDVRIWGAAFAAVLLFCALGWAIWSSLHKNSAPREAPLLAVMAFQNLNGSAGAQAVSGQIAQEVAQGLVGKKIKVAAMPSDVDVANTGAPKPLAVTHVLSGSVENVRGRVHVIAQLMDIRGDRVVWSHSYDGGANAPQTQISAQIVNAVGKLLASSDLNGASNVDPAAYAHYTKGLDLYRQRDWRASTVEFQEALRAAPNFAQAWSALATARWRYAVATLNEQRSAYKPEMAQSARAAADRALALNPNEGQAMGVLALLMPPSQLIEIDRKMEQALRAAPHNPQLLEWHGRFLMFVGRNHDALDKLTRAYELDNTTPSATSNLIIACLKTGHYDVAKEILNREGSGTDAYSREMSARLHVKYFLYVRDWFRLADYLRVLPNGLPPRTNALLGLMHETAIALATRETDKYPALRAKWRNQASTDLDDAAQVLFALGDADGTLDMIEAAVKSRQNDPFLSVPQWEALFDPNLVPLRRNPRLPALFAKWGLLNYWQATNRWPDFVR